MKTAAVAEGGQVHRMMEESGWIETSLISMESTTFIRRKIRAVEMKRNDFLDQRFEIDHDDD